MSGEESSKQSFFLVPNHIHHFNRDVACCERNLIIIAIMEQITEYVYPTVSEYGKFVIQYKLKLPSGSETLFCASDSITFRENWENQPVYNEVAKVVETNAQKDPGGEITALCIKLFLYNRAEKREKKEKDGRSRDGE